MLPLGAGKKLRERQFKGICQGYYQFQRGIDLAVLQLADPGTSVTGPDGEFRLGPASFNTELGHHRARFVV